jgi:transposase
MNKNLKDINIWNFYKESFSQRKIATILEVSRNRIRKVIKAYKNNQILCHQRGVHQRLNFEVKRRIGEHTLSDANLTDQKLLILLNAKTD